MVRSSPATKNCTSNVKILTRFQCLLQGCYRFLLIRITQKLVVGFPGLVFNQMLGVNLTSSESYDMVITTKQNWTILHPIFTNAYQRAIRKIQAIT